MAVSIAAVSTLSMLVWVVACRRGLLNHEPSAGEWREMVLNGLAPAAARLSWLALVFVKPGVGTLTARGRAG